MRTLDMQHLSHCLFHLHSCDRDKRKRDLKIIFGERIYYEKVRVNDISKKGKKNKLKIKKSNKVRK